eukprot:1740172-Rhodomonas_salina.1
MSFHCSRFDPNDTYSVCAYAHRIRMNIAVYTPVPTAERLPLPRIIVIILVRAARGQSLPTRVLIQLSDQLGRPARSSRGRVQSCCVLA